MINRQPEGIASPRRFVVPSRTISRRIYGGGMTFCTSAVLALASAGQAFAVNTTYPDATISFTGTFIQPTCTVDSSTANQTIALDAAQITAFPSVGSTTNPKAFNMIVNNCAPTTQVTMTVSGTMDTVTSVLKNTGTAAQVGVQILQAGSVGATTGTPVTLNSAINFGTVDATNSMTIPLVAQYYQLGTAVTPGTVAAIATVNFTYN
jgi:major type 1 subunit fimbrin (pilin)